MANPQKENGYTPIANEIMDALAKIRIPGEARQILDAIMRKTYGWRKCEDVISLSQFVEMTGMQKPNICRAINRLLKMNIIIKKDNKNSISYGLQKDFEKWKALSKKITLSKTIKTVIKNDKKTLSKMIPTKEIYKETNTKETVDNAIALSLATFLRAKILEAKPDHRPISDVTVKKWAVDIDRMMRLDKRDPKRIRNMIIWLFDENLKNNVSFVVESAKALRNKYDRIEYQMNKPKKQGSYLTAPEQYEDDEWEREHVHVVR